MRTLFWFVMWDLLTAVANGNVTTDVYLSLSLTRARAFSQRTHLNSSAAPQFTALSGHTSIAVPLHSSLLSVDTPQ
jgi:hypothetical protein